MDLKGLIFLKIKIQNLDPYYLDRYQYESHTKHCLMILRLGREETRTVEFAEQI